MPTIAYGLSLLFATSSVPLLQEPLPPASSAPIAREWGELRSAFAEGKSWFAARLRYEDVDQDGFTEDAHALTLRSALGFETAPYHGFVGAIEFEDVSPIGHESFNSTTNGNVDRPIVADPDGAEVNQVWLSRSLGERVTAKLGRQRITFDNHRWIGNVVWRQNEQTYDAMRLDGEFDGFKAIYGWVRNVNRVFGDSSVQGDQRMNSHLLNVSRSVESVGSFVGYAYLLDNEDVPAFSSNTAGLRGTGKIPWTEEWSLTWTGEFAHQTDAADNPNDVSENYLLGEIGAAGRGLKAHVGWEALGGSRDPGEQLQTPLATLFKFNGWADKFLSTPNEGIEDLYVGFGGKLGDVDLLAVWHDFSAETGGMDWGEELDLRATWPALEKLEIGAAFAKYDAEDFASDTTKFWVWVETSL